MSEEQTITIDGQSYPVAGLSDDAKAQIQNLTAVDQEIARLNIQMAIAQTARASYGAALKAELEGEEGESTH